MTFESVSDNGMRPMQWRFLKNGKVKMRVVGKGSLFTWVSDGECLPNETPEQFMARRHEYVTYKAIN